MRKSKFKTIDEYISTFPIDVQPVLETMGKTIRKAAPEAVDTNSYQIPTFKLGGNVVHFGAHKNHIGFYPTSSGIEAFKKEISSYEWSKGTVQFPLDTPI